MKTKSNRRMSLTQLEFGAAAPKSSRTSSRKHNFLPNLHIQEAFKKVLAAIASLRDARPRIFSSSSKKGSKEFRMSVNEAPPVRTGVANPMLASDDKVRSKSSPPAVYGAYNVGGLPQRAKKQRTKVSNNNNIEANTGIKDTLSEPENNLDSFSDNPRYLAKLRKAEKAKRLAAGETLESINKDMNKKMPKKRMHRSPMPPGVV